MSSVKVSASRLMPSRSDSTVLSVAQTAQDAGWTCRSTYTQRQDVDDVLATGRPRAAGGVVAGVDGER
jgi:hypothetical protein